LKEKNLNIRNEYVTLAFYIAKNGTFFDKLIAWWTKSKYSHVELIIDGYWYSTSPRDGTVRRKIIPISTKWDYIEVPLKNRTKKEILEFYERTKGQKYDWINIFLCQIIPLGIQIDDRWICSEWCTYAISGKELKISPQELYELAINKLNGLNNV